MAPAAPSNRHCDPGDPGPQCITRITGDEGGSDHVDISPERDTLAPDAAGGPWTGSDTSWRGAPQSTVTLQVVSAVLLVYLGLLLGWSWTIRAVRPNLHRLAEERHRLDEEWSAVRTAPRYRDECSWCGSPLSVVHWYLAPTVVEDEPDDD